MSDEPIVALAYCYVHRYPDGSRRPILSSISADKAYTTLMANSWYKNYRPEDVIRVTIREVPKT